MIGVWKKSDTFQALKLSGTVEGLDGEHKFTSLLTGPRLNGYINKLVTGRWYF